MTWVLDVPKTPEGVAVCRIFIFGPQGSGKSVMGASLIEQLKLAPKERIHMVGPVPVLAEKLGVAWHNVDPTDRKAQEKHFGALAKTDEHIFIAVDEFDAYCTKNGYKSNGLYQLVNFDRNFGKALLCIARGTSDVSTNTIANCDLILWFRTTEQNLLNYIHKTCRNFPGGREEAVKTVSTLPQYQCLIYQPLAPDPTQQFPGFLKVVNGRLRMAPMSGTHLKTDSETVSTPDAEGESGKLGGPTSARSTTPNGK